MIILIYCLPEDSVILGYNAVSMDNLTRIASYLRRKKSSVKKPRKPQNLHITFQPVSRPVQRSRAFLLLTSCHYWYSTRVLFQTSMLVVSDCLVQYTVEYGISCMQVSDQVICGCKQKNFTIIKIFSQNPARILRIL